jgi:hypothetical protein
LKYLMVFPKPNKLLDLLMPVEQKPFAAGGVR